MKFAIKRLLSIALSLGIFVLVMAFASKGPATVTGNNSFAFNRARPPITIAVTVPTRR